MVHRSLDTLQGQAIRLGPIALQRLWLLAFRRSDLSQQQGQLLEGLVKAAKPGAGSTLLAPIKQQLTSVLPALLPPSPTALWLSMAGELKGATSLAGFLEELGYPATANEAAFRDVLQQLENVTERDVAQAFGMMARTHSGLSADPHSLHASLAAALGSHAPKSAQPTVSKLDLLLPHEFVSRISMHHAVHCPLLTFRMQGNMYINAQAFLNDSLVGMVCLASQPVHAVL